MPDFSCPDCGHVSRSNAGNLNHQKLSGHGPWRTTEAIASASDAVDTQEALMTTPNEMLRYSEEKQSLTTRLTLTERDLADARKASELAGARVKELETQLAQEKAKDLPSVTEFVKHCEDGSCHHHAEWQQFKQKLFTDALNTAPKEIILQRAKALGYAPVAITPGTPLR